MILIAAAVVGGECSWRINDCAHSIIMKMAQQLIKTEKIRIPTVEILDLPIGYSYLSFSVVFEIEAVYEIMIPAMISKQESAKDDMIVYDEDVDIANDFDKRRRKFRQNEQYVEKRTVKLISSESLADSLDC